MTNQQLPFGDDLQWALNEGIQGRADHPRGRVLDRYHAKGRLAPLDHPEDFRNGSHRQQLGRGAELLDRGALGERSDRSEVGHRHRGLQGA